MITIMEIEMLASLLARAGITQIEAHFANSILERLRAVALEQQVKAVQEGKKDDQGTTDAQP